MPTQSQTKQKMIEYFLYALEKSPDKDKIFKENKSQILKLFEEFVFSNDK